MGDDPFATHLLTVLSATFPAGEQVFIDAVRSFRDQVRDPRLLQQMRAFISQEGQHRHRHETLNRHPERFGLPGSELEQRAGAITREMAKRRTPLENLAMTAALEHFTAVLCEAFLTQDELRESVAEPFRSLWTWHCVEELDHKAVAFDVYQEVSGDYATRVRWMLHATLTFVLGSGLMHLEALHADGQLRRPRYLLRRFWKYWRPRTGHFARLLPLYLAYYRRDFHPFERDHAALIRRFDGTWDTNAREEIGEGSQATGCGWGHL